MTQTRFDNRTFKVYRAAMEQRGERAGVLAITNQLPIVPGQRLEVWIVQFTYKGPARQVVCGFALKPRTSLFGTNWNNGYSTIPNLRAFSEVLNLPASAQATPMSFEWPNKGLSTPFGFSMPSSGTYNTEGTGTGQINNGGIDTWVWLADATLIQSKGDALTSFTLMDESNLLVIDTDAGVVNLASGAATTNLQVGYRNAG